MTVRSGLTCWILALAAVAWAVLLASGPWVAAAAPSLGGWLYAAGSLICHQRPDRSFHVGGAQLPVCARCLGLYAGAALGVAVWALAGRRRAAWDARRAVAALAVAGGPTFVTVLAAWVGVGDPSNAWRAALAAPLGVVAGMVVGAAATNHLK